MNLLRNCCTALQNTLKHVCTTAERIKNQVVDFVKNVDWKKVAIVAAATVAAVAVSVATAGAAAPVVAGLVGSVGLTGFGAAVATGVGVGVIAGAAGGGTQALVSGALSGKDGKTILKDTWEGIKGGAVTGAFTGGLTAGLGAASSSVTNGLVRHGVDTVGETVIDTISDAAQGGQITPTSIGTSLFLNAVTEGVSSRTVRAPKADVVTTKPKSGDVPVTRPRKDVTPVQQLALPGPISKPLALPAPDPVLTLSAPKATAKPDFYVKPSGDMIPATSPYSYLQDSNYVDVGKKFTATQKEAIIKENMIRNGGVVRSDLSGEILYRPQKSQKGVTPNPNEWQIDHIIPKTKGGSNSYANAQVLSRFENRMKSDYYSGGD